MSCDISSSASRTSPSHLMCSHLALGRLAGLQALVERRLDGLHLGGDGLEGLLVMLLSLQGFVQTLLLLADLFKDREGESGVE